jgi:LuxR family transcriptional regulator
MALDNDFSNWQDAHTQALMTATTEAEFFTALSNAAQDLGFEYCAYGMRMPLPLSNPKVIMLNNYSEEWRQRYAAQNYLNIDPTVAHGIRSVLPLIWNESVFESARPLWEDARAHGLKVGWAQSSYNAQGAVGMLTMARSNELLTPNELRKNSVQMTVLAQLAHEGMSRLVSARRTAEEAAVLTAREIEVLRWTADGKTSGEVGQIMNISERTVNFHINNSLEKLGAVNKTAAVIKAALMRLL